jgi:hypothetical protein
LYWGTLRPNLERKTSYRQMRGSVTIRQETLPSKLFPVHYSPIILAFDASP